MSAIVESLRSEIVAASTEQTRASGSTFFKERILIHGAKSADVRRISKAYTRELRKMAKSEIFALCEELWQSGYLEECVIAGEWSLIPCKTFTEDDFKTFERWISQYVTNWATCDTFCNHTVGDFVVMYPRFAEELKRWAVSENRWMRRAAAVSLIVPAKRGQFLAEVLAISEILLTDEDDMVQKGYGWLLKAATEKHTHEVFEYVCSKREVMPRTALRYAIEKMPKELKTEAMMKIKK